MKKNPMPYKMTKKRAITQLATNDYEIKSKKRLPSKSGWKITLKRGDVIVIYDTGEFYVYSMRWRDIRSALTCPFDEPIKRRKKGNDYRPRKQWESPGHDMKGIKSF